MSLLEHNEEFVIRTYEIDTRKRTTLSALVQLMQEAAMQHVLRLKLSVWDLESHQVSWVLMRKHLWIDRLPMLGEKIRVFTRPSGIHRIFTYRDYIVYDSNGQQIAAASSTWLLMHTEKRKMAPLPPFLKALESEMPPAADCLPRPDSKLPVLKTPDIERSFRVDWHDLDFNLHLNNTRYLQWMLETLPTDVLANDSPTTVRIEYRNEALFQQQILAETAQLADHTFLHQLKETESGNILASAVTEWRKNS
jgi:medium-chain acyl-[acyl-carrier-protein] hydrolase